MIKWDEIVMISVIINDIKVNVNKGNIVPFSHSLSLSLCQSLSLSQYYNYYCVEEHETLSLWQLL